VTSSPRIVVTGANGFVGAALLPHLQRSFPTARITAVGGPSSLASHGADLDRIVADLTHEDDADRIGRLQPDIVVHLAARSSVAASVRGGHDTMEANLVGTVNLAKAIRRRAKGAAFIFASSAEVYGASFRAGAAREGAAMQPQNAYARSKAAAEWALTDLLGDAASVTILRLFNHTGPGQGEAFVIPSFAAQIARIEAGLAEPVIRVGNLSAIRDFLDLADVLTAYGSIIEQRISGAFGVETFNVCSGNGRSIQSIVDELVGLARLPVQVEVDPTRLRPSDIPVAVGDSAAFRERYEWTPRTNFNSTLEAVLDHWRSRIIS
jgi:GDP-4-dehydro-6-deoxy-D-mannose reductase